MKNTTWILAVLLVICLWCNLIQYYHAVQAGEVVSTDTTETVTTIEVHDTMPAAKAEKVIKYIPYYINRTDTLIKDGAVKDSIRDSLITLPIVQRIYTDDTTYTAYISGVRIDSYPKLDSIKVRQKLIERTITNTVRERRKIAFKIRPAVGVGYGIRTKQVDMYVGVAGVIDF